jgi:hypothetical protein
MNAVGTAAVGAERSPIVTVRASNCDAATMATKPSRGGEHG